jgi:5'-nucleotidase
VVTDIDLVIDHQTKDVKSATADNVIVTQDVAKDAALTAIVDRYRQASAPIANQIVGSITANIPSQRDTPSGANAAGEISIGDVIADAQLAATAPTDFGGSQIAFMNAGGIRGGLFFANSPGGEPAGQVTYGELFTVQPFGNSLVVKTCTGAQIKAVLEQQFTATGGSRIGLLQVSDGFTYSYNSTLPTGSRVSNLMLDGTPINPATSYRVTMNSFLAPGGDGFTVFGECTQPLGGEIDLDALVRYFQANSPVAPGPQNRITKLG